MYVLIDSGIIRVYVYVFFFFQAEDGIRDLVRSRGLGDVYKRQLPDIPPTSISLYLIREAEQGPRSMATPV